MANGTFPIIEARQELGFTPTTAVRADIDVRTGEGAVGAAIGQGLLAGAEILSRIQQKRQQMTDANSAVVANKLRQTADTEYETFKLTNPQETWQPFRQKQTQGVGEEVAKLNFSPNALVAQRIKSEAYSETQTARALTDATRQLRTDTIQAQTEALVDAFRSGNLQEILDATTRYNENGANMGKDKAEVLSDIKAAKEVGEKLRKEDTLKTWRDRIAEKPVATAETLNNELVARKQNKGVIPEAVLTSTDIQSLLNTATNRQSQLTANAQAELNAKNAALETQLHNDIVAGDASITEIANSGLPAAAQRRLEGDIVSVDKRDIARTWAIQDSPDVIVDTNAILTDLEAGIIDINEARHFVMQEAKRQIDGRSVMTRETFDKTMTKITNGGRDAIDFFVDEQVAFAKNALTKRLTDQQARFEVIGVTRDLTPTERREAASVGYLLQVNNHQLLTYESTLNAQIRRMGIEDTSGNEAKAEAVKLWQQFRLKPLSQKIDEFKKFSGQRLEKPEGFPDTRWENLDSIGRAAVVEGFSKRLSVEQILEALNK